MKTMNYSVWLDCRVQGRISGRQGDRWRLRIASEFTVSTQNRKGTQGGGRKRILIARFKFLCTDPELSCRLSFLSLLVIEQSKWIFLFIQLYLTCTRHTQFLGKDFSMATGKHGLVPQWSASFWLKWAGSLIGGNHVGSLPLPSLPPWSSVSHTSNSVSCSIGIWIL